MEERLRHPEPLHPQGRQAAQMFAADQLQVGLLDIGIGDHDRRTQSGAVGQFDTGDPLVLDPDAPDRGTGADLPTVRDDHLAEPCRVHLAAALGEPGAVAEEVLQHDACTITGVRCGGLA
ncbi:hypothetical protein [Nocardia sp. NPDC051570]|uniref:hypothetical protein n=1 Tax=Nocardia sp. NPDC051570 TaxID=3364324 RepID=UPI0037B5D1DC